MLTLHRKLEDTVEQETIYIWDGPDGPVRVTLHGSVSDDQMRLSRSVELTAAPNPLPDLPSDLLKVRLADGPRQGHLRFACRYELTPEQPEAGTNS
jgi:hypothetical protein